jgi:hypothetical protein
VLQDAGHRAERTAGGKPLPSAGKPRLGDALGAILGQLDSGPAEDNGARMPTDLSDSPEDQQLVEAFAAMAPTLDALFAVCMCVCVGACVCLISLRRSASLSVIPSLKLMDVFNNPPPFPHFQDLAGELPDDDADVAEAAGRGHGGGSARCGLGIAGEAGTVKLPVVQGEGLSGGVAGGKCSTTGIEALLAGFSVACGGGENGAVEGVQSAEGGDLDDLFAELASGQFQVSVGTAAGRFQVNP